MTIPCWVVQVWRAWHTDPPPMESAWVRRHQDRCAHCRQWAADQARLAAGMVATARSARRPSPPFLAARIIKALGRIDRASQAPSVQIQPAWTAAAAVLCGLLVVAVVALTRQPARVPVAAVAPPSNAAAVSALLDPGVLPGAGDWLELGGKLDDSLEVELEAVISDARGAINFLAQSLLPTSTPP